MMTQLTLLYKHCNDSSPATHISTHAKLRWNST
jgi:hypothetical protein